MKFRANKMLGVALGERSILVAEVVAATDRCQVTRASELTYSGDATLQNPAALGAALGTFLRKEGFAARTAVFGIPARWVLSKSKEVPPAAPAVAADLLRLQVESDFSPELKDLVYDYAGQVSPSEPRTVLLVATPKRHIEQVSEIALAAKLNVQGVAPTASVLGAATARSTGEAMVLSITPSGTELAAQQGAGPAMLRHVGGAVASAPAVAGEVRRAALLLPRHAGTNGNGSTSGNGAANGHPINRVVVWDDAGLDPETRKAVNDALGIGAQIGDLDLLGAGAAPAGLRGCASAVALAIAGMKEDGLPVDFQHSRLAPPVQARIERRTVLAIGAVLALIVGIVAGYLDLRKQQKALDSKTAMLATFENRRKPAEQQVKMIEFAEKWHAGKPRYLNCLRDLTNAVPDSSQLYLINFNLNDGMKGSLAGKTSQKASVLRLVDSLYSTHRFADIKIGFNERVNRTGPAEVSFNLTFTYLNPAQ